MILFRRVHSSYAVVVHMQSRLAFDISLYMLLLTYYLYVEEAE